MPKKKAPKTTELNLRPLRGKLLMDTAEGIVTFTLGADETLAALRAILAMELGDFPVQAYSASESRATKRIMDF